MFHKQKGWFSGGSGKQPKKLHSLENLKLDNNNYTYLYI